MNNDKIVVNVNFKNGKRETRYVSDKKIITDIRISMRSDTDYVEIDNAIYDKKSIESINYDKAKSFGYSDFDLYEHDRFGRINYVLGVVFTKNGKILLQRKNRGNSYINGKLNGLGGKIEDREKSYDAMEREFIEETGWTKKVDWKPMMQMEYDNCILKVFHTIIDDPDFENFEFTSEDENAEELIFIDVLEIYNHQHEMANNLIHIISICLDDLNNG